MIRERTKSLLEHAVSDGITSPKELANFMAQVSHESYSLSRLNESFIYTQGVRQITSVVPSALREGADALAAARKLTVVA